MRFGTADLWNTNVGTSRIISKVYKHPLYTPGRAYFDVGVVEAQKILEFTNYVMPICLPMRPIDDEDALEGKIKFTKYKVMGGLARHPCQTPPPPV